MQGRAFSPGCIAERDRGEEVCFAFDGGGRNAFC
jgi:hypothetical protein